jgi:hypothetical protein
LDWDGERVGAEAQHVLDRIEQQGFSPSSVAL